MNQDSGNAKRGGQPKHGNKKKNDRKPNKPCFVCKETGHWPSECPKAVCRKCGTSGHMASICPSDDDYADIRRGVTDLRDLEAKSDARALREVIMKGPDAFRDWISRDVPHHDDPALREIRHEPEDDLEARLERLKGEDTHGLERRLERLKEDGAPVLTRLASAPSPPATEPVAPFKRATSAPPGGGGSGPPGGGPPPPSGGGSSGGGGGGGGEVVVLRPPPPPITPVAPARAPRVMKRSFRAPDDHELHDQRDIYIANVVDREPVDRRAAALKFAWAVLQMSAKGATIMANLAACVTSAVATFSALTAYDRCLEGFTGSEVRATKQMMLDSVKAAGPVTPEAIAAIDKYTSDMAQGGGKAFEAIDQATGCRAKVGTITHRLWTVGHMWWGAMKASSGAVIKAAIVGAVGAAVIGALYYGPALLEGLKGRFVSYSYLSSSYAPSTTDMRPTSQKAREGFYQDALMTTYEVVDSPAGWRGLLPEWMGYTVRRRESISMELFVALTEPRIQAIIDVEKLKQAISHRAGIEDRIYTDRYLFSVNMVAASTAAFAWHYFMSKLRGQPPVFW